MVMAKQNLIYLIIKCKMQVSNVKISEKSMSNLDESVQYQNVQILNVLSV